MAGRLRTWLSGEGGETADLAARLRAAEAANEAKTRFLASVAHEIRSPLNAIYGYAQLIERGEGRDPVSAARTIRRSAEHLAHLVEGLLDMAQVEGGALKLEREAIRFPDFLEGLVAMLAVQAEAKGLALVLETPPGLPEWVQGDPRRLRQVLINLLGNAIKFTDAGQVTLKVEYRNQLATFAVIDTGIGIAPEDAGRIFAPFERIAGPAAERPGAGLGLAITQALVHIMGGEIRVESALGAGSRFTVRLMLSQPLTPPETLAAPEPGAITGYLGRERWVLAVDDEPGHLAMLRALLEPLGFQLRTARDSDTALAIAAQAQPDLVLCDIALGGEDGRALAAQLRGRHGPALRIVMLSGEPQRPGDQTRFIAKPFDFADLLQTIGEELGLEWVRAPGAAQAAAVPGAAPAPGAAAAATFVLPPHIAATAAAHCAEIERLVRIGHVRAIEAEIAQLAALGPETAPLAEALCAGLDRFDLKALAGLARRVQSDAG
ncbi:hybrid sensor histidine kinase/response regulator [Erythrobacter sp. NE805]|uniref:ATP-binding response regulator n=1 Tax=Erythrobacter sp. NE805 TaxID=3389875 RepID=UPI00396B2172